MRRGFRGAAKRMDRSLIEGFGEEEMVGIIFGSKSDTEKMRGAAKCLDEFGIRWEAHVLSAHRVPEELKTRLAAMEDSGVKVFICGAGLAAHLPGVAASMTTKPVIGVPLSAKLGGTDSLYSIVQMPKPIPVATVGIDNSYNAGMLAVEILALADETLARRLSEWRVAMKKTFIAENESGDLL